FAAALGVGHAEGAFLSFFGVAPLLVTEDHDRVALDAGDAAQDGTVVGEATVAAQLKEIVADELDVVGSVRALFVAGDLDTLPWGQLGVGRARCLGDLALQIVDLLVVFGLPVLGLRELLIELGERLLEVEIVGHISNLQKWARRLLQTDYKAWAVARAERADGAGGQAA